MSTKLKSLKEGSWCYRVDERGRIPLPPEIIERFGKEWIWAIDPREGVVLFPLVFWQEMLTNVKDPNLIRREWNVFARDAGSQRRVIIPAQIIEKGGLSRHLILTSLGNHFIVRALG